MSSPVELAFSQKYNHEHAQQYLQKHQDGLWRRLSHWRDEQLARRALTLAGDPGLVLDLPCGAGRFWPLLAGKLFDAATNAPVWSHTMTGAGLLGGGSGTQMFNIK